MSRRNLPPWVSSAAVSFHEAITERRAELGWTRTRVAKAVDVSPRMMADYEKGIAQPSLANAVAIATTLRMSLDAACGLADARPFSVEVDGVLYVPVSAARAEQLAGASPERPRSVEEIAASADVLANGTQPLKPKRGRGQPGRPAP